MEVSVFKSIVAIEANTVGLGRAVRRNRSKGAKKALKALLAKD
jgi:hypothetical protein